MLDLIIRGGDVVTPQGVVQGDVAVAGETIAAIAAADVLSAETAKHVINATGHIVIPGGISQAARTRTTGWLSRIMTSKTACGLNIRWRTTSPN
jgi:dihydroorotase-like cyclic amidohydrolase